MSSVRDDAPAPTSTPDGQQPDDVRMLLAPAGPHHGMLDGAWWPRSKDPLAELPPLIAALGERTGTVVRVTLDAAGWDGTPPRLDSGGRTVELDWSSRLEPDMVTLTHPDGDQQSLLVVPPAAGSFLAVTAMAMIVEGENTARPEAVLATCEAITASVAAGS